MQRLTANRNEKHNNHCALIDQRKFIFLERGFRILFKENNRRQGELLLHQHLFFSFQEQFLHTTANVNGNN
jgi:hypothetical protein